MWARDLAKTLRQSGQEYTNRGNKLIPKKEPKICDCSKCRFQCSEIGEELRRRLCAEYYALADSQKQKLFLSSCMRNGDVRRRKESRSKNREVSRSYFLPLSGTAKRVCKKFFAATFCISERMLSNTAEQSSPISGLYVKDDGRKGKPTHNATPPEHVHFIKNFIDCFPRVPSQSCRRDAKCEYLSTVPNLNALYRLYREKCIEIDYTKHVGRTTFSSFFRDHDPKLSFNVPRKDQCSECNASNQQEVIQKSTENSVH